MPIRADFTGWTARTPADVKEHHLALKPIDLIHGLGLVIASRQVHVLRVQHLESHHCQYDLQGEGASIHKIACMNSDVIRHPWLNLLQLEHSQYTSTPSTNIQANVSTSNGLDRASSHTDRPIGRMQMSHCV